MSRLSGYFFYRIFFEALNAFWEVTRISWNALWSQNLKKKNCFNIIMKERGWIRICFSLVGLVLVIVEIVVAVLLDQRLQVVLDGGVAFLQSKLSKNASRSLALIKIFKKINYILHSSLSFNAGVTV